jgi:hypothetical protein
MATPTSTFNWYDNSALNTDSSIPEVENKALFFVVSSFDKGPEDLREVEGTDFDSLYGTVLFSKHGQNGIQAKHIIDAGGKLLVKRVVADDSMLANLILCARVTEEEVQKTNANGEPIYLDADGNETTEVTDKPVMIKTTVIKWESSSIANCSTFEDVENAALDLLDEAGGVYPLFVYTDNGRGISSKAIRLVPDYYTSKGMGFMLYNLNVYEGTTITEKQTVGFDPNVLYRNESYAIDLSTCEQIKSEVISSVYETFVARIAKDLGIDTSVIRNYDLVYGYDYKGNTISGLTVDTESVDLNSTYGLELAEGSNGAFGDAPVGTDAWTEAIRKVFAGEVTDEVWDVDTHKIAAVVDANLPDVVKDTISDFVNWREDCVFFRDLGIGLTTFGAIKSKEAAIEEKKRSKFVALYSTSYTIKDPNTYKNIEVTMLYDLAAILVSHFNSNAHAPLAGVYNGFILDSAIKGTVSFTPIITPSVNQKDAFEDMKVNYAIFNDDQCVVQSCYTSQTANTELSYINNVLAIQEVVRALRTMCPRQRYKLVTGNDLSDYATACQNVLENYTGHFNVLRFTYTEDKIKAAQKIFYASIEFAFNQWAQTEIFDVYALNSANL